MKFFLCIAFLILGVTSLNAQEKGKVRVGMDLGWAFASGGGGLLFDLEPKYNLTDNSNVGLRIVVAARLGNIESDIDVDANISFLGTYDYYFNNENSSSAPFIGGGLGLFVLGGSTDGDDVFAGNQVGGLIRGGIELGKLRLAFEYNIIPKSKLEMGQSIENSYLGASIGFYLGGGKWKNK